MEDKTTLKKRIQQLEKELKEALGKLEKEKNEKKEEVYYCDKELPNSEIERFHRQILLVGKEGHKKIKNGKVLVIGVGGLGSACCLYLSSSGIGKLGFVDFDVVEATNLHRQVMHCESRIGMNKAISGKLRCKDLNSLNNEIKVYTEKLTPKNAISIIKEYDVVVDCTDNVLSRYLINDACVFCNKPLVSGSAVKFEGQLTVYNYQNGPCYRCLFPNPPPKASVLKCKDFGVLGVVPGIIGSLQALEVQKILLGDSKKVLAGKLLIFDAKRTRFRQAKLRGKQKECCICGTSPSITTLCDVEKEEAPKLEGDDFISMSEFFKNFFKKDCLVVDIREKLHYDIACLEGSISMPLSNLKNQEEEMDKIVKEKDYKQIFILGGRDKAILSGLKILKSWNSTKKIVKAIKEETKNIYKYIKEYPRID